MALKPIKSVTLAKGIDWEIILHQYDNDDHEKFYQVECALHSDTGASSVMTLGLESDFDPQVIGTTLIKF